MLDLMEYDLILSHQNINIYLFLYQMVTLCILYIIETQEFNKV